MIAQALPGQPESRENWKKKRKFQPYSVLDLETNKDYPLSLLTIIRFAEKEGISSRDSMEAFRGTFV